MGDKEQYDDDNVLAVIGVLFEIGDTPHPVLEKILTADIYEGIHRYHGNVYNEEEENNILELYYTSFDLMDLLPANKEFIGYEGSLTTPPCLETVRWHVMKNTVTISQEQLDKFKNILESTNDDDLMAPNWRPLQNINDRKIYQCRQSVEAQKVQKEEMQGIYTENIEDTNDENFWFIVGVVFICLFAVALIVIGYLLFVLNGMKRNNNSKGQRRGYQKTASMEVINDNPSTTAPDVHTAFKNSDDYH